MSVQHKDKKSLFAGIAIFVGSAIIVAGLVSFLLPVSQESPTNFFEVLPRTTNRQVVQNLSEQGYIRNKTVFSFVLGLAGGNQQVESAVYQISSSMSAWRVAQTLIYTPYGRYFTIAENSTPEALSYSIKAALNWTETEYAFFLHRARRMAIKPGTYLLAFKEGGIATADRLQMYFAEDITAK